MSNNASQALLKKRQKESDDCYFVGCACLSQLERELFQNRILAKKASQLFIVSAKKNRKDPRPLVKLAYLVFVFGDDTKALKYLERALKIAPENPEALSLKDKIENHDPTQYQVLADTPNMEHELHFSTESLDSLSTEEIYKQLENLLNHYLDELENTLINLKPTLVKETLEELEHHLQIFESQGIQLADQKRVLESRDALGELSTDFEDFDGMLGELKDVIQASQMFQSMTEQMTETINLIKLEMKTLRTSPPDDVIQAYKTNLDAYWNIYESVADQLEMLEKKEHDIKALERYFNPLGLLLEKYQTILDRK